MLLIFMGASCTGKSTVAEVLKEDIDMEVYTGKDYLRFAKNENEAWNIFNKKLLEASNIKGFSSKSIIYIISDKNILTKLKSFDNAIFVKFTADLNIIKDRFAKRTKGNLSRPIEKMLEKQVKDWENTSYNLCIDTTNEEPIELAKKITDITEI